jgi:flavin reductase (DIM6/NTAB) family NADH-FMN oxidoreductase RutF
MKRARRGRAEAIDSAIAQSKSCKENDVRDEDWLGNELDPPMFVVTAHDGSRDAGCLVGFATQCSISPLRFLVFLSKNNLTYRVALGAAALAVHVVPKDRLDLARLFGAETGDDIDKLSATSSTRKAAGTPVLDECSDWFLGRVVDRLDVGDHLGFLLEPQEGETTGVAALGFQEVRHLEPGHPA